MERIPLILISVCTQLWGVLLHIASFSIKSIKPQARKGLWEHWRNSSFCSCSRCRWLGLWSPRGPWEMDKKLEAGCRWAVLTHFQQPFPAHFKWVVNNWVIRQSMGYGWICVWMFSLELERVRAFSRAGPSVRSVEVDASGPNSIYSSFPVQITLMQQMFPYFELPLWPAPKQNATHARLV